MTTLPKRLLKEKLPHEICCNIALLALALNSTGTLKKSGLVSACDILDMLHHFDIFGSFSVGRSVAGFRTSGLAMMDEMNQKTRSTSTLMGEMLKFTVQLEEVYFPISRAILQVFLIP